MVAPVGGLRTQRRHRVAVLVCTVALLLASALLIAADAGTVEGSLGWLDRARERTRLTFVRTPTAKWTVLRRQTRERLREAAGLQRRESDADVAAVAIHAGSEGTRALEAVRSGAKTLRQR